MNLFPEVRKATMKNSAVLGVWKWHFAKDRIGESVVIDGKRIKKILTLDINIPDTNFATSVNNEEGNSKGNVFAKEYPCPHACLGCFNNASITNSIMRWDEVRNVVNQAIQFGLESVKFLGPGELIANPELFDILDWFQKKNIVVGIFTKGAILGSDALSQKYHDMTSKALTKRLVSYDNITFLVGGRSFDPAIENRCVPTRDPKLRQKFDYHQARNIAIERFCKAGMNNSQKQRLAISAAPVTDETIDGAFEVFKWGFERNIPVYLTTTMVSGKGHLLVKSAEQVEFERKYISLAVKIYSYLLNNGVATIEQLKKDGVSSYIGTMPCNQLTHGLYIHYDGEVRRCPGNDTKNFIEHHNIRESKLLDVWLNSKNYQINKFNNHCVKDGISIPSGFYTRVLKMLKK